MLQIFALEYENVLETFKSLGANITVQDSIHLDENIMLDDVQ